MDVSVIIPARNAAHWIGEQLDALSRQTFEGEWEIIVADNGSTDGTTAVVRSWTDRLPNLRVVRADEIRGANHARNRGVASATGRLLAFCDADDRASDTWLERLAVASEQAPFLGGTLDLLALNSAKQRLWYGNDNVYPGVRPWPNYLGWVTSANFAITSELAAELGPFDTQFVGAGDDIALSWRATMLGTRPTEVADAVMHYRLRPAGLRAWKHQHLYGKRQASLYREFATLGLPRRSAQEIVWSWAYATGRCRRSARCFRRSAARPRCDSSPTTQGGWSGASRSGRSTSDRTETDQSEPITGRSLRIERRMTTRDRPIHRCTARSSLTVQGRGRRLGNGPSLLL